MIADLSQRITDFIGFIVDTMHPKIEIEDFKYLIDDEAYSYEISYFINENIGFVPEGHFVYIQDIGYPVFNVRQDEDDPTLYYFQILAQEQIGKTPSEFCYIYPYYFYGTPIDVNKEFQRDNEVLTSSRYPAIILWEVIRQSFDFDKTSNTGTRSTLILSFLDNTQKYDWTNIDQYQYVINKMEVLANQFIKKLDQHPYTNKIEEYQFIKHSNWGSLVSDRGHTQYILDDNLAGLNLEITLPIKKNCLNKNSYVIKGDTEQDINTQSVWLPKYYNIYNEEEE